MLTGGEKLIALANIAYVGAFGALAVSRGNHEFLMYAGVILFFFALILHHQRRVRFDMFVLGGLTVWGLSHMSGGLVRVGGDVLYNLQLVPVVLRYDQLVHFLGFGVATLACFHLLKPHLRPTGRKAALAVLVVMMGCGLGAMNEIVEFVAVQVIDRTNVGGYDNTLWDLVFNLFGASAAVVWLNARGELEGAKA